MLVGACDRTRPYGAIERGRDTFFAIRGHLRQSNSVRPFTFQSDGVDVLYFSYSASFKTVGSYTGEEVRQKTVAESATLLGEQIAYWGTDGNSYDIITHSLGGAVAAYWAATEANEARRRSVHSITTIDSPLNGVINPTGLAAAYFDLGEKVGQDLLKPATISTMQQAPRNKVVTLANTEDLAVLSSAAEWSDACPLLVFLVNQPFGCTLTISGGLADPSSHGVMLNSNSVLQRIDRILAGSTRSGLVKSAMTGLPVAGATVSVVDTTLSATTGSDGRFTLTQVPLGDQTLKIVASGFQEKSVLSQDPISDVIPEPDIALLPARIQRVSVAAYGAQGNGHSYGPSLSADGRFVAFHSEASNLVPGDTNGGGEFDGTDVFVVDRSVPVGP